VVQEKKALKEEKMKQEEKYMWAVVDGVKEKVNLPITLSFSPKGSSSLNFCLSFRLVISEWNRLAFSEAVENIPRLVMSPRD